MTNTSPRRSSPSPVVSSEQCYLSNRPQGPVVDLTYGGKDRRTHKSTGLYSEPRRVRAVGVSDRRPRRLEGQGK